MSVKLYNIDEEYCKYLRFFDSRVPHSEGAKNTRPYVGTVLTVNNLNYYAPLTSPKPKQLNMKGWPDFVLMAGGSLGGINLNNILPIEPALLTPVDLQIKSADTKNDISYKFLLTKQTDWCNANIAYIEAKAQKLYNYISLHKAYGSLERRCCDFLLLEKAAAFYQPQQNNLYEAELGNNRFSGKIILIVNNYCYQKSNNSYIIKHNLTKINNSIVEGLSYTIIYEAGQGTAVEER